MGPQVISICLNNRYCLGGIFIFLCSFHLKAQTIHDGFLSMSLALKYHNTASTSGWFTMPVIFEGVSQDYDLRARFLLISDLLNMGDYYSGNPAFVQNGQLYEYNFFSLSLDYAFWVKGNFIFHAGWAVGHKGFMHSDWTSNGHNAFVSARGSATWFFYKFLTLSLGANIPLAVYQSNSRAFRQINAHTELLYDPIGPARFPSPSTVFFILGCEYQYTAIEQNSVKYNQDLLTPYFKFSFLY